MAAAGFAVIAALSRTVTRRHRNVITFWRQCKRANYACCEYCGSANDTKLPTSCLTQVRWTSVHHNVSQFTIKITKSDIHNVIKLPIFPINNVSKNNVQQVLKLLENINQQKVRKVKLMLRFVFALCKWFYKC